MEVSVLVLLTLCLDWVWEVSCTPWSLYPKQKTSDRCFKGGCIGPRADIEVLEVGQFISSPGIKRRFLGRPAFSLIITPNELPRFTLRSQMAQKIRHILWWFPTRFTSCSAVTATHSHRPLTAETQVLFQAVPCAGVCVCLWRSRAWTRWHWDGFFPYWGFPCRCNSTNYPYYISLIYHWRPVT